MAYFLAPAASARPQFFTSQGAVLAGGKLYWYLAGTTTPEDTYTDSTGGTANANPIVLDSAGRPSTGIYLEESVSYKLICKDSSDNTIFTQDNIVGVSTTPTPSEWVSSGFTPTYISATQFSVPGDQTATLQVGRKLKIADAGGTKYCRITVSAYTTLTTITLEGDTLASPLTSVNYGLIERTNTSFPAVEDDELIIVDPADPTKRVRVDAGNVTAGQTRVLSAMDKNSTLPALEDASLPWNVSLAMSVAANALTIALKTRDGGDPSAGDPAFIPFRNATVATGDYTVLSLTAASSLVIPDTATLGTANSTAFRYWVVGFNDAGTFRIGVINCLSGTDIYRLGGFGIGTSVAIDVASDSAHVFYTGTAVTDKAYTVLGYLTYESGLATAGTYASAPTRVQLYGPGVALPGNSVQTQESRTGAVATGTTIIPTDDTIPQNTEGDEYMSKSITPTSAANLLDISVVFFGTNTVAANGQSVAVFKDTVADARAAVAMATAAASQLLTIPLTHRELAAGTTATTFKVRSGPASAATTTFNGSGGVRRFGGVASSFISISEVMA